MRVKKIKKMNQKGMTLVEVIVAMAILAIVIAPTLRIFASTSSTTMKSRQRQRATSVAEGVFESLKAYNMEALCVQFTGGTFKGVVAGTDTASPLSMSGKAVYGTNEEYPLRDDLTLKDVPDKYKFHVSNAASEGYLYDVDIEATPLIAPEVLKMDNTNAYSDAIITLDEGTATLAFDLLKAKAEEQLTNNIASYHSGATDPEITDTEISDFKRVIDVTVSDNGAAQEVVVKVTCTATAKVDYKYKVAGVSYTNSRTYGADILKVEHDWGGGGEGAAAVTELTVYNNDDTIAGQTVNAVKHCKLNQIFLYYFPCYTSVYGSGAKDEININGTLSNLYKASSASDPKAYGYEPLRFIVAKQVATTLSDVDLNLGEVGYKVEVANTVTGGGEVEFRSNLGESLAPSGSVPSSPTISGFASGTDYAPGELKDKVKGKVALLYDVKIEVYEAGTTNKVAEFTGTMNE